MLHPMPRKTWALSLYCAFMRFFAPAMVLYFWRAHHARTAHPKRIYERYGITQHPRPNGRLLWVHTASVGEARLAMPFLDHITALWPHAHILFTTGTTTAAAAITPHMPARTIHQYAPFDSPLYIKRFVKHWQPNLAVFVESDLWPGIVHTLHTQHIPVVLLYARFSKRTRTRLRMRGLNPTARALLSPVDQAFAQNTETAQCLSDCGLPANRISIVGTAKQTAAPLVCAPALLHTWQSRLHHRPLWLAASTHQAEEAHIIKAHSTIIHHIPNALLLWVPRHPIRGGMIYQHAHKAGWVVALRSGQTTCTDTTQIYIADTIGEMGLWYRLANIAFIGGSIVPNIGGHNPFEPVQLNTVVLHGGYVDNFAAPYRALMDSAASYQVHNAQALAHTIIDLLEHPQRVQAMHNKAQQALDLCAFDQKQGGTQGQIADKITAYFNALPLRLGWSD